MTLKSFITKNPRTVKANVLNCEHDDCNFIQINEAEIKSNAIYFVNVIAKWTIETRNAVENISDEHHFVNSE